MLAVAPLVPPAPATLPLVLVALADAWFDVPPALAVVLVVAVELVVVVVELVVAVVLVVVVELASPFVCDVEPHAARTSAVSPRVKQARPLRMAPA